MREKKGKRLRLNLDQQHAATQQSADTPKHGDHDTHRHAAKKLTPMQQAFGLELSKGVHKTDAYISAFAFKGTRRRAENSARRLAKRADIQDFVSQVGSQVADLRAISVDDIKLGIAQIAFSDVRKLFGPDGEILPVEQWPTDAALAVSSYTEEVMPSGLRLKRKIAFWDKPAALKMLAEINAMLNAKPDATQRAHFVFHLGAPVKGARQLASKTVKAALTVDNSVDSVDNSAPITIALPGSTVATLHQVDEDQR